MVGGFGGLSCRALRGGAGSYRVGLAHNRQADDKTEASACTKNSKNTMRSSCAILGEHINHIY